MAVIRLCYLTVNASAVVLFKCTCFRGEFRRATAYPNYAQRHMNRLRNTSEKRGRQTKNSENLGPEKSRSENFDSENFRSENLDSENFRSENLDSENLRSEKLDSENLRSEIWIRKIFGRKMFGPKFTALRSKSTGNC